MKRTMVIIVVALIVGALAFVIGHKMGKNNALKAMNANGADQPDTTEEEAETTA